MHSEAKRYGFTTKSFGKGDDRAVRVFKKKQAHPAARELAYDFGPREETVGQIKRYLERFPPNEDELAALAADVDHSADAGGASMAAAAAAVANMADVPRSLDKQGSGGNHAPKKAKLGSGGSGKQLQHQNRAIDLSGEEVMRRHGQWADGMCGTAQGKSMMALRKKLPIAAHRDEILQAIASQQVILIAGETGCGKTTQVPQYILEDCWSRGEPCRIMCTQPRRLSATSVADRIAQERLERIGSAGASVGYMIRLDKKGGSETPIMFVTNGIMLRMLTSKDGKGGKGGKGGKSVRGDQDHSGDGEQEQDEEELDSITHIVIDEIHERDRFADFMLIIIRDLLPRYPRMRIVLMSATLHEDLFSNYFGGCPVVRVPGFTFPVREFFLEDILRVTGYERAALQEIEKELGTTSLDMGMLSPETSSELGKVIEDAFRQGSDEDFERMLELTGAADTDTMDDQSARVNFRHPETGCTPLFSACFRGRGDIASVLLGQGADPMIKAENGMTAADCAEQFGHGELADLLRKHSQSQVDHGSIANQALALSHYQSNTDLDEVDIGLIEELLMYVCGEKTPAHNTGDFRLVQDAVSAVEQDANAVLVFLPGWDEITRLRDALEQSRTFGNKSRYQVLPLHSMISQSEQRMVFQRPPKNVQKIILSTNIAETSITIDDVAFVIDSGRQKEKSFDPYTGIATLMSGWVSKASARQRRGRAGRCRDGLAFRMYSSQRYESMEEYQAPELMRTPLDEMVLQVKIFEGSQKIADFLGKAPEPPIAKAIDSAVELLERIGALEEGTENLTLLGRHLAALPIPPMLGKMLMYGVLFQCLDPILTVACALAYREFWVLPVSADGRRRANATKRGFAEKGGSGGCSDHMASIAAYAQFCHVERQGDAWGWCNSNFMSAPTLRMIKGMREQLINELTHRGFITNLAHASSKAANPELVRSTIAMGLYPNYGRLGTNHPNERSPKPSMVTHQNVRVRIHPSSVNASLSNPVTEHDDIGRNAILVYDELVRGDARVNVRSTTEASPHAVLLCASSLTIRRAIEFDDDGEPLPVRDVSADVRAVR